MITSTSTPGSMLIDVFKNEINIYKLILLGNNYKILFTICLTTSDGLCKSITRLCIRI